MLWIIVVVAIAIALGVAEFNDVLGDILLILAIISAVAVPIFYWIYLTGREPGQTVGKRALRIRVRHAEQDRAIGYGPAAGRYLITVAFGIFVIPSILDYLWPLFDRRNQSLHDRVATSVVVRV